MNLFPEERNEYHKNRSCEDHIFTLDSSVQNCLAEKKSTFCSFIDLEKAFDWTHNDLLSYKLLGYNIDGKMDIAVQNLFGNTVIYLVMGR